MVGELMKTSRELARFTMIAFLGALSTPNSATAEVGSNPLFDNLRQESSSDTSFCPGVQRTIAAGNDAFLVVRTAIEIGYNSCQVMTCALAGKADPDKETLCEKVIRGAVSAGVQQDVIARCSSYCDPAAVAEVLAATMLEPNYCYFSPRPVVAPGPPPSAQPLRERSYPRRDVSPYSF